MGEIKVVTGVSEPNEVQGWTFPNALQGSEIAIPTLLHTVKGDNVRTVTIFSVHAGGGSPIASATLADNTLTVTYLDGERDEIKL